MLDYKQEITSAHKIAKTMVSFANHKGGTLLVGVRDNRTIAGIRTEDEKYMLDLAASFYCKPEIILAIIEHQIGDKVVLECIVPEGDGKPYYAKGEDEKWWVYIRINDKSVLASKIVIDVLKRENNEHGIFIEYSSKEKALLEYLDKNERITSKEYSLMLNLSRRSTHRILVNLVLSGVIRIHTTEKEEYYTAS